jgi:hypothetical protein
MFIHGFLSIGCLRILVLKNADFFGFERIFFENRQSSLPVPGLGWGNSGFIFIVNCERHKR